ncbi:hypothetical protein A1F95_09678, partial [Pyrenophora tritici-repentis]
MSTRTAYHLRLVPSCPDGVESNDKNAAGHLTATPPLRPSHPAHTLAVSSRAPIPPSSSVSRPSPRAPLDPPPPAHKTLSHTQRGPRLSNKQ